MKPVNYLLQFEPDLKKFIFRGIEIISFELDKQTNSVTLNAADLKIIRVVLESDKTNQTTFSSVKDKQQLVIGFSKSLTKGRHKLLIKFIGEHNDKLVGWYRSKYITGSKVNYLATSHFEPADARRAFPCVDNPSFKATFDIEMVVDKNLVALSNMGPVKEEILGQKKRVVFHTTPKMSTYLVYLGVGKFEFIEERYKHTVLRGVATQGNAQYTKFALDVAKKSLAFYEKYFDYPYPLNSLDLIAVPDFSAGAMENWGAVTFRENALLYYPEKSSQSTKQRIAEVVAHELAHQWFGNLVTMKWWDDLWLNESFATYMAYKAMDVYWPEWRTWPGYIMDNVFGGMHLDSLNSSHPIKTKISEVGQVHELFDEIAYDKGGSVLRMLDLYLGEKTFQNGLRSYIKKYQYKNAEAKDLWEELEHASKTPVKKLMQSYVEQIGFPVVEVKKDRNVFALSQKRFTFLEKNSAKEGWIVPLCIRDVEHTYRHILIKSAEKLKIHHDSPFTFINSDIGGFFLTMYDDISLNALLTHSKSLSDEDMLGLIHDEFALVMAGKKTYSQLQKFIFGFKHTLSTVVSYYLIARLIGMYMIIQDSTLLNFAIKLSKNSLKKISYRPKQGEDLHVALLRSSAISTLILGGDEDAREFIQREFDQYLINPRSVHPDLHGVVFSSAVSVHSGNYGKVMELYRRSTTQEEQAKLLVAIGNTKEKELIAQTLKFILSDEIRFIQIAYGVAGLMRNLLAYTYVYSWFMTNWHILVNRSNGLATMILRHLLQDIVPIAGIGYEKEIAAFLHTHSPNDLKKTVDQVLEELAINSRLVKKYKI